jgi:hypothetical protein
MAGKFNFGESKTDSGNDATNNPEPENNGATAPNAEPVAIPRDFVEVFNAIFANRDENGNVVIHIPEELLPEKMRKGGEVKNREELDALIQVMLGIAHVSRLRHIANIKLIQWPDSVMRIFRDPVRHAMKLAQEVSEKRESTPTPTTVAQS